MFSLLSFLFNNKCVICGCEIPCAKPCAKNGEILCESCVKNFELYTTFPQAVFEGINIFSAVKYDEFSRSVVKKFKFNYKKDVSKTLGKILYNYFNDEKKYVVIPIPAHKARLRKYGFNHTETICKEFAKLKGWKINNKILLKQRETLVQHFLNKEQRFKNIKDSFKIDLKTHRGENLLIVDDITTTGATFQEVIKTFKEAGVNNIVCLSVFK